MGSRVVIESVNTSRSGKYRMFRTISVCLLVLVQMVKAQEFCESSECSSFSLPVMTAIVVASVTCVLAATLDHAASASGVMVELMDARKSVNKEREQKCAKNVWLNVSNMITTYTVDVTLNKFIKR